MLGAVGLGAWRQDGAGLPEPIHVARPAKVPPRVVGSRSHESGAVVDYLAALGPHTITPMGSSLKICLVAEGAADLYPRLGPTSEWDTAAAQAILESAGGRMIDPAGQPLTSATGNRNGYILELTANRGDHTAPTFTWDLMLVCGDPTAPETYFAGFDKTKVSPISCPDNVAFDSAGNLWIATDGNVLGSNDGLFRVPVAGPDRGRVQQFVTMPRGAETCGPFIADKNRSLFFAVQHPGESDTATFETPTSTWPHTDDFPRPSVCVAFRKR